VEAAIHQMEFHRREVSNSPYPYGLKLLVGLGGTWFHGGDPARVLRFDDDLARLRLELNQGAPFEDRIRAHLLDNPHRVRFTLVPDTELAARETERERAELREIQARLTDAETEQIRADAAALESLQEEDEDLSVLPTLELTDIPPSVPSIDPSEPQGAVPATWFEQPTSGILYFTAAAGCGQLPENLTPMLPFFCYALNRFSTARSDYTDLVRRIDRYTGGIGLSVHARTRYDGGDGTCAPFVTLSGKSLERNVRPLFEIIAELMREFQFTDTRRLRTLLNEFRANRESMIVRAGHSLAMSAATRNFNQTRALNEIWNGIRQYQTIKAITDDPTDERLTEVGRDLEAAGRHLFSPANLRVALIGEEAGLRAAAGPLGELLKGLPGGPDEGFGPPSITPDGDIPREGWSTTSAVSFVARAFPAVRMGHPDAPALAVMARMLRSLYIHREIRERGGAYGGFALYNSEDGVFAFGSYRDPHIVRTLSVYDDAETFIREGEYDAEDVKEAILQVCADIDRPDPPGQAARKAFYRQLIGLTDEDRKRFKEGLLRLTPDAIRATAGKYFGPDQTERAVAVVSGDDQLKAANGELGDRALNIRRI
jgi:Zn-dependent M16 (insulinase) family peptidase